MILRLKIIFFVICCRICKLSVKFDFSLVISWKQHWRCHKLLLQAPPCCSGISRVPWTCVSFLPPDEQIEAVGDRLCVTLCPQDALRLGSCAKKRCHRAVTDESCCSDKIPKPRNRTEILDLVFYYCFCPLPLNQVLHHII